MAAQREWFEKDYYAVLGVSQTTSHKDITKAYRRLAREFHPDANPGNAQAEERFKEISAAYDVVGDETRRKEYDEVRRMGPMGGFAGPGGQTFNFDTGDGLGDLLGQMFGRGKRSGAGVGPQRGGDIEAKLTLDFIDAAHGLTTSLHLRRPVVRVLVVGRWRTTRDSLRCPTPVHRAPVVASSLNTRVLHVVVPGLNIVHGK